MKKRRSRNHPLFCWDIAAPAILRLPHAPDEEDFRELALKHNWTIDPAHVLMKDYEAIVVTTIDQKIVWASRGFRKMTGYAPSFARHKRPSFLQGPDTDPALRATIREALQAQKPVSGTLINYRKDGTPYRCHVSIEPIRNNQGTVVHFMALERSLD